MLIAVAGFTRDQFDVLAKDFGVTRLCFIEMEEARIQGFKLPTRGNIPLVRICVHSQLLRDERDRLLVYKLTIQGKALNPPAETSQCPDLNSLRATIHGTFHPEEEEQRRSASPNSRDAMHVMRPSRRPTKPSEVEILVDKHALPEFDNLNEEVKRLRQLFIDRFALKYGPDAIRKALLKFRPLTKAATEAHKIA